MDPSRTDLIELLALATLEDAPLHGYGVYKEMTLYFGESVSSGKIYSVLNRLEDDGLVRSRDGEGRRVDYALTSEGEAVLAEVRDAPDALRDALVDLFALEPPAEPAPSGPWRDVTVHRDMVRDKITIELERGEGATSEEVDRLLRQVMQAVLGG